MRRCSVSRGTVLAAGRRGAGPVSLLTDTHEFVPSGGRPLARSGRLSRTAALGVSVITLMSADFVWYEGRRLGDRILNFLGLSRDPASCVNKATAVFARHGARTLPVSKFLPWGSTP